MNYGYQNELDFVKYFNNKYIENLDENSKKFIADLFDNMISNDEPLKSWKNKMNQKADFFIKYKNYVKCISLKCGNGNSIHHEQIQDFRRYLESLRIPYKVIEYYVSYHYGYLTAENGKKDFTKVLSAKEYKKLYQDQLDIFNSYLNKTKIIIDMIDRFIIRGKNSDYDIDALISGTINNYTWIKIYDIYDLILSLRNKKYPYVHCACMTIGPQKRNIYGTSLNRKDRYMVCIRWNFIREEIEKYRNNNNL